MRRFNLLLFFGALVVVAGYFLLQTPSGREFFLGSESKEDPLAFLEETSETFPYRKYEEPAEPDRGDERSEPKRPGRAAPPVTQKAPKPQEPPKTAAPPGEVEPVSVEPAIPNQDLARLLLGILRARNLAEGISLGVANDSLSVIGEVESEEVRNQILEILENGRGARRLEAAELRVK